MIVSISYYASIKTDGFVPYKIPSQAPFREEWKTPTMDPHLVQRIFGQSFHYLGKGHQCFAFESEDGQYVLKLPIHARFLPPFWLRYLPVYGEYYRSKKILKDYYKLAKDARSYLLAYKRFPFETALVHVHLNRTDDLYHQAVVIDKMNIPHSLDLDQTEFILQRKAEPLLPMIERWMEEGHPEQAHHALSQLICLFHKRYAAGIEDRESLIEGNFGILGEHVVQIDIGRLRQSTTPFPQDILWDRLTLLRDRLQSQYPELALYLERAWKENLITP